MLQKLEFGAATAGASVAASRDGSEGDGSEAAIGGGPPASVAGEENVKGDVHEKEVCEREWRER